MWDDAESTLLSLAAHSSRQRSGEYAVVFGYGMLYWSGKGQPYQFETKDLLPP